MIRRFRAVAWLLASLVMATVCPRAMRAQYVRFTCDSAHTNEIRTVDFEGNRQFTDAALYNHVSTTESDFDRWPARYFGTRRCLGATHTTVASDMRSLKLFYADQGFPDAKVDTAVARLSGDGVRVTFIVAEGLPVIVNSIEIRGLGGVADHDEILKHLNLRDSSRYSDAFLRADVDSIRARLANVGYPLSTVIRDTAEVRNHRASVHEDIDPGPLAHFGGIAIQVRPFDSTGHQEISSTAVRGILGFASGDRYADRSIANAQRILYQLGAYQDVTPDIDTSHTRADSAVDVIVNLHEDQMHQLTPEFGWATLDCFRTQLQYTDKAFMQSTRELDLNGQVSKLGWASPTDWAPLRGLCYHPDLAKDAIASDTLNYNLSATLSEPGFLGGHGVPKFTVYSQRQGAYQAYLRTTLIGGGVSVVRDISRQQSMQYGYNLELGHTDAQPAVLCFIFRACDADSQNELTGEDRRLAVASVSWTRDSRDDRLQTTSGTILRAELRASSRYIGSDTGLSFVKAVGDASWYHTLFGANVLALRLRVGAITGGEGTAGARLPPPQERLFAGGPSSVRGFQPNEVGALIYVVDTIPRLQVTTKNGVPDSTTTPVRTPQVIPVGGNSLVVGNIEYRLPGFFSLAPQFFQTILFTDVGDVWTRELDSLHLGQRLRWTPGIGVRWISPVGLIQGNLGYNPYARPLGPLYYSPGVSSGFALYCISPSRVGGASPSDLPSIVAANPKGTAGSCPATYTTGKPATFLRQLTFTLSIGTDF